MSHRDPGPVPNRWLRCPRKATGLVAGKFLAFKTPLGSQFNDKVPEENRFTPSMLFDYMKTLKVSFCFCAWYSSAIFVEAEAAVLFLRPSFSADLWSCLKISDKVEERLAELMECEFVLYKHFCNFFSLYFLCHCWIAIESGE